MHLKEKVKYAIIKSAAFALSSAMLIMSVPISVNAKETQYADGTFEGSGKGHVDTIVLDVTIANGKIVDIKTKQQNETPEYWEMAVPDMYNNIINKGGQLYAAECRTKETNGQTGLFHGRRIF